MYNVYEITNEVLSDLSVEIKKTDERYDAGLMASKVKSVVREVIEMRHYPSTYTDKQIERDLLKFYSVIRNVALYDYNSVGAEGEASHSENGVARTFISRASLFYGVNPIAQL